MSPRLVYLLFCRIASWLLLLGRDSAAKDMVYILSVNGAVFENLAIQGGIQAGGSGIDVASSSNVVIASNTFDR